MWLPMWPYKCLCQNNRHRREDGKVHGWERTVPLSDGLQQCETCMKQLLAFFSHTHYIYWVYNAPNKYSLLSTKIYMACKNAISNKVYQSETYFSGTSGIQSQSKSLLLLEAAAWGKAEGDWATQSFRNICFHSFFVGKFIHKLLPQTLLFGDGQWPQILCSNSMSKREKKTQ